MIYRRHLKSCSHRRQRRRYWQCQCPCWVDVRKNGIRIHKSMNTTDYEAAKLLEKSWLDVTEGVFDSGSPRQEIIKKVPISIADAWQKFLGQAEARKLSPTSIYKYDLLRRRIEEFAKRHGLYLLRDLDTDVLELFQSEWKGGDVTLSKTLERL